MGEHCVFMLATDLSRATSKNEQRQLIWWLRNFQDRAPAYTRVLVVGTCRDKLDKFGEHHAEQRCKLLLDVIVVGDWVVVIEWMNFGH